MKKRIFVYVFLIMLFTFSFAHPGKTDSNGGHYDRSTGEYHYHHGYPAHSVCGKNCPYNKSKNTDYSINNASASVENTSSSNDYTVSKPNTELVKKIVCALGLSFFLFPAGSLLTIGICYIVIKLTGKDFDAFLNNNKIPLGWIGYIECVIFLLIIS